MTRFWSHEGRKTYSGKEEEEEEREERNRNNEDAITGKKSF